MSWLRLGDYGAVLVDDDNGWLAPEKKRQQDGQKNQPKRREDKSANSEKN